MGRSLVQRSLTVCLCVIKKPQETSKQAAKAGFGP
jgi:hypothetical protein